LMDAQLPDMQASELATAIKSSAHFNAVKLVIMTGMADHTEAQHFRQQGFSARFPKPLTTSDLFDALAVILEDAKALKDAPVAGAGGYLQFINQDNAGVELPVDAHAAYTWVENMRLLLVEDNCINQEVAKSLLEELGLSCDVAADGEEALSLLNTSAADTPYSLILMDCQMPIMDGYTTTRNIRLGAGGERYKAIPIIALTANAMQGDKEKCLEAGMSDYLSKPIEPTQLERILVKWQASKEAASDTN
ncbi:MAG: response regulator, partial [Bermanella sp.]